MTPDTSRRPIATVLEGSDGPVIVVAGELDLVSSPELAGRVQEVLADDPRHLTFDLKGVSFIDSAGFAALVMATATGRTVVLKDPNAEILRLLDILSLGDNFEIKES